MPYVCSYNRRKTILYNQYKRNNSHFELAPMESVTFHLNMTCITYLADVEINLYFHSVTVAFAITSSLLTVIFNSIYLISIVKFTRNFFPNDIVYILLSVSDLLAGFVYMPTWCAAWIVAMHQSRHECFLLKLVNITGHILADMSLLAIVGITLDIYLSILHPFFYEKHVTNRRTFLFVTGLWLLTIVLIISLSAMSLKYWRIYENTAGIFAVVSCVTVSLMHIKIYLEIKSMCRKVPRSSVSQIHILKTKKKVSRTGTKILLTFILCFLPISCCVMYRNIVKRTTFMASYAEQIAHCIFLLNPLLDPFVYYFRLSRIRSNIRRIFVKNSTRSMPNTVNDKLSAPCPISAPFK